MNSSDYSNNSQKGSTPASQTKNRPRPSLYPLRNSASRKNSIKQFSNVFCPHLQIQNMSESRKSYYDQQSHTANSSEDLEFQFKSPAQINESSPKTPGSNSTSRKVPKQFQFDTPYVPFVHQHLPRQTWRSQEIITQDAQIQKKQSQMPQQQQKIDRQILQIQKPDLPQENYTQQSKNMSLLVNCDSNQQKQIKMPYFNDNILNSIDQSNIVPIKSVIQQNICNKINKNKISITHQLLVTPKQKILDLTNNINNINITPYRTQCISQGTTMIPITTKDQNIYIKMVPQLNIDNNTHNFFKNNIHIEKHMQQNSIQINRQQLINFQSNNVVSIIISKPTQKQQTSTQCQYETKQISIQTNNKPKLSVMHQECTKFDVKYGYEQYLQKKFQNFMELVQMKFKKQVSERYQEIITSQKKQYTDSSCQYDPKQTYPRPSLKRVSIYDPPRISLDSQSTEQVIVEQKKIKSSRKNSSKKQHKNEVIPEESKKPLIKKQPNYEQESEFIPDMEKKSRRKTGKTPNKKKKSKK